jgi:transcriptional antiterminator RfaH
MALTTIGNASWIMHPIHLKSSDSAAWYAVFTKPRQEDRAAGNLKAWDVPTLVPKIIEPKKNYLHPLFPCYIFAYFDARTMLHKIRFTRGISQIVSFGGRPANVSEEIIAAITSRMDNKGVVSTIMHLQPGNPVFIHSGPFQDFYGIFEEELSDAERVRILLTAVSYTARIEVYKYDVTMLGQERAAS